MEITIRDDFIKLGQAMKLANLVMDGAQAKFEIQEGKVRVNGEEELRRGRKLVPGDSFTYNGQEVTVRR